jgi:SH3/ankyrin repeat-containing protein
VLALGVADKSLGDTSDIISDSSGVGTANSDTTYLAAPGSMVVCIESYSTQEEGHLSIREGDIIEGHYHNRSHCFRRNEYLS